MLIHNEIFHCFFSLFTCLLPLTTASLRPLSFCGYDWRRSALSFPQSPPGTQICTDGENLCFVHRGAATVLGPENGAPMPSRFRGWLAIPALSSRSDRSIRLPRS